MYTEEQVIYTLWDNIRAGQANQDDPINERLLRNFLRIHRGRALNQAYSQGASVPDEAFQELNDIVFTLSGGVLQSDELPKIIRFKDLYGITLSFNDWVIPVMQSERFNNAGLDRFVKFKPRTKYKGNKLVLNIGMEQICDTFFENANSTHNINFRAMQNQMAQGRVTVNAKAVLVNTDDGLNYDWTADPYPLPDELIENILNSVKAREFDIFLRTRSDETGNQRDNSAEYNTREEV